MSDTEKRENIPEPARDMTPEEIKTIKKAEKEAKKAEKKALAERKKAKKKAEKQKNILPLMRRPLICPPEASERTAVSEVFGIIARAAVLFFAVLGMSVVVTDALGFFNEDQGAVSVGLLAGVSLLFTALLTLCAIGRVRVIAIPVTVAAAASAALYAGVNGVYVFRAVVNGVVKKLYSYGYLSVIKYAQPEGYGDIGLHGAVSAAAALLAVIYALAYVPFLIRRTRPAVPVAVTVVTLVPVFVYNLTKSNWGITLIIAAFSGAIIMCVFDGIYQRRPAADRYDTETCVFESAAVPEDTGELTSRERRRLEKKEARRAARSARRAAHAEKKQRMTAATADEEITDYFATPKKRHKKPEKKEKEVLTAAGRKAKKAEQRRRRAEEKQHDREIMAARRRRAAAERRRTVTRASAGGFAGASALIIVLAVLFVPSFLTEGSFRIIESIDAKIDYYREYVTAFLMGDDPLLDELAYAGRGDSFAPRSTEARHLNFTGARIMQVEAPNGSYPIYLRGWIATDYDHAAGSWLTATPDSDTFKDYRRIFGTAVDPSEAMLYGTYRFIAPDTVSDLDFSKGRYSNNTSKYGFVSMQVNMKRIALGGHLVYMPSYTNRRYSPVTTTASGKQTTAMREWQGSEASKLTYTNYFDGIYTGYRFAKDKDGYASVAYVTSMKNPGFYKNVAEAIAEFNLDRTLIRRDEKEKAESYSRYGTVQSRAGVFHTEKISDTRDVYAVLQFDDVLYYVEYDPSAGTTIITVPDEQADYVYTYRSSDGSIVSKKAVRKLTGDPELDAVYIAPPELPALIRYLEFYTDAEKTELAQLWRVSDFYTNFVYNTYTGKADSSIVTSLVDKIMSEAHTVLIDYTDEGEVIETIVPRDFSRAAERGYDDEPLTDAAVYEQRHLLVLEFIKWLKENCTYTLTPALSDAEGLDGVEKFLTVTHEGYCVQFASSLALMLREAGIPARYVEGYIASDFYRMSGSSVYSSYVLDKNAHAWVEVWFDGIGWMQYEATPEYYSDMYEYRTDPTPVDPGRPGWSGGDEDEPEDPGLSDEEIAALIKKQEEEARRRLILKIVVISLSAAAFAAVAAAVFVVIRHRAKRCAAEREELIRRLETAGRDGASPDDAEKRELVLRYSDMLTLMLAECGCTPEAGEFRSDYADRAYELLGEYLRMPSEDEKKLYPASRMGAITRSGFRGDLDTIAAAEFGGDACRISDSALFELAKLWRRLAGNAYRDLVGGMRRRILWLTGKL